MSKKVVKSTDLQQKLLAVMEVLFPPLIHMLNLSIVEIVIHGQVIYEVMSDSASILFMMAMAMIFQAFRKKISPDAMENRGKAVLVVS